MFYNKEDKEVIERKSFELSIELWDRFWKLFSIDEMCDIGIQVERKFFVDMKEEFVRRMKDDEPRLWYEIIKLTFDSFKDDFKRMVEKTKDAIGQLTYDDIPYDPEENE